MRISIPYLQSTIKVPVSYTCPHCKRAVRDEYECTVQSAAGRKARRQNQEKLAKEFAMMANRTDPKTYCRLDLDAFCPHCDKRQPWSKSPSPWLSVVVFLSGLLSLIFWLGLARAEIFPFYVFPTFLIFAASVGVYAYRTFRFKLSLEDLLPEEFPVFHLDELGK